ncbi:hypothetical protein J1605_002273 [Eschrichtius robustus]|uniref:Uncharacterized protein n=1 Tax=Eschrichtius robustus TaxID=9764 RepID=A0AB34I0L1_ESCRO|nr:hypothetical protein J1605_002273 [Eschrichtius robustus]
MKGNSLIEQEHPNRRVRILGVRNITKDKIRLKRIRGASLVAQWLRIRLPMQGTRVRALVWEDPACRGAAGPVSHDCRACAVWSLCSATREAATLCPQPPFFLTVHLIFKVVIGASLVAQWLRIRLPMQRTRVQALVWEDPTCHGATKLMRHNY